MGRYTSLLLTAFVLMLMVIAGSAYMAGHADNVAPDRAMQELTVYTTLPAEHAAILADAYAKEHKVRVNFVPLSENDILQKLRGQKGNAPQGDLVLADQGTLRKATIEGRFIPYISERSDSVPEEFKDLNGFWTGVWHDPVVFCVNRDYLSAIPHMPDTWTELASSKDSRLGITDFVASDASANLFFSLMSQYGDQATYRILRQIHPRVVQYSKYLSTPVRMAGMGEVDISVAVQSETMRYIHDGYPLQIVYPADGTAYLLAGTGILQGAREGEAAKTFADWLLSDDAQLALQKNGFFFTPTNPATIAYQTFGGKNLLLFGAQQDFTAEQRRDLMDRWMKYIRFQ